MDIKKWTEKIRQADPRALARALSEIENRGPQAAALLRALFPFSGQGRRIGVTGSPGVGKSTLVNRLAAHLRRAGRRVAIVAVDPTSPFTGGSILGDRVRMQSHHRDPEVFIRSMATRGSLGGLAPTTADVVMALEASGRDSVIVETVGAGQAEVDVVKLTDVVAVVLTPSMGDDVQTIKAGIMEIADVFVINKADLAGADQVHSELEAMLSLAPPGEGQPPAIIRTVATEGAGLEDLAAALDARPLNRQARVKHWQLRLAEMIHQRLVEKLAAAGLSEDELAHTAGDVAERRINPYEFVDEAVGKLLKGRS